MIKRSSGMCVVVALVAVVASSGCCPCSKRPPDRFPRECEEKRSVPRRYAEAGMLLHDYQVALRFAEQILEENPGDLYGLTTAVQAACQLGDRPRAEQHYSRLPQDHPALLRVVREWCAAAALPLPPDGP